MKPRSILVCGGAGYIGSHMVRLLVERARQRLGWTPAYQSIEEIIETAWRWHCSARF